VKKGLLADLTIIDVDPTSAAPAKIPEANVVMTVVGGEIVFERK